ncbi:MAG: flagellar biosynthetic protein FliR [Limnobacter sp.]|nr:flagellar biosynthetic protein FliR [Limnobacter sp.]
MIPLNTEQLGIWIAAFLWPFLRILAMLSTAPVFDNRAVQRKVRVGLAAMIAIVLMQVLPPPPSINDALSLNLLLQQILIGAAMGFSMRLIFTAFEVAGDMLGLQMGLAFAQFIDPQKGGTTPLIGSYLSILASLVFLALDGHLLVIAAVVKSFELVPISANLDVVNANHIAMAGSIMFMLALQIAIPVLAALIISNVILGILARAAPQLNVMSIGFSITITAGIWVLWISMPYILGNFDSMIGRLLTVSVLKG